MLEIVTISTGQPRTEPGCSGSTERLLANGVFRTCAGRVSSFMGSCETIFDDSGPSVS